MIYVARLEMDEEMCLQEDEKELSEFESELNIEANQKMEEKDVTGDLEQSGDIEDVNVGGKKMEKPIVAGRSSFKISGVDHIWGNHIVRLI